MSRAREALRQEIEAIFIESLAREKAAATERSVRRVTKPLEMDALHLYVRSKYHDTWGKARRMYLRVSDAADAVRDELFKYQCDVAIHFGVRGPSPKIRPLPGVVVPAAGDPSGTLIITRTMYLATLSREPVTPKTVAAWNRIAKPRPLEIDFVATAALHRIPTASLHVN